MNRIDVTAVTFLCLALAGCGGSKVLKEEIPVESIEPLAYNADGSLEVSLDMVVVRDGPGTWAKNADWDEYRLRVTNFRGSPVMVQDIVVHDMRHLPVESSSSRRKLVKASKKIADQYEDEGVVVVSGAGTAVVVGGAAVTTAVALTASMAGPMASGAAMAGAGVVLAPVLITGGVLKGVNNSKVSREIRARSTELPLGIVRGDVAELIAFFPLTVSPTRVELIYEENGDQKSIFVDTTDLLAGLHVGEGKPKKKRQFGQTRWAHPTRE